MQPSEMLRQSCSKDWQEATEHSFCLELVEGSLAIAKMQNYLIQDYTFIDNFVRLASRAIYHAPTLMDRLPLARFLGVIAGPENTYFQRSFTELGITQEQTISPELMAPTAGFQALMLEAAQSENYGSMIAVLCVAEWVYLSWAAPYSDRADKLPFYFGEWISLHCGEYFESVVAHLRGQLDIAYDEADEAVKVQIASFFKRAVVLEKAFFDRSYEA